MTLVKPQPYRHAIAPGDPSTYAEIDTARLIKKYPFPVGDGTQSTLCKNAFRQTEKAIPKKIAQLKRGGVSYVGNNVKRVHRRERATSTKYVRANQFIADIVIDSWNCGAGLTKDDVKAQIIAFMADDAEWMASYGERATTNKFVSRAIQKIGFTDRKNTISQKIPGNWKDLTIIAAARTRATFSHEKVEVVLADDETFIRFNESGDRTVAPIGSTRVGLQ
jgi:hypothetical protein